MHVDEGSPSSESSSGCLKIEVVNSRGECRIIGVTSDCTVEQLKIMSVNAFHPDPLTCVKMLHQFRLILLSKRRQLKEGCSLREEEVTDRDIVLLLPKYEGKSPLPVLLDDLQREANVRPGPSESEILSATSCLEFKNLNRPAKEQGNIDFQRELRKILVTLIDFAAKLLHAHPEVEPIISSIPSTMCTIEEAKKKEDDVSETALQQLVDMGFSTEKAKRALKLNNMSPLEAMDWLLAYDSSTQATFSSPGSYSLIPSVQHHLLQQQHKEMDRESYRNAAVYAGVESVVQAYRAFKRKTFKVNSKAVSNLKQMGFDDHEVLDALWIHTNNEVAACEWLLSDRRPNSEDLRHGLRESSPVYKAMMSDATVQLGLLKPRILFSLLQLLEEPNSMGRWLNDSETSPVLSQIFRIYHSEKHATIVDDVNQDDDTSHGQQQSNNESQGFQTDV